MSFRVLSISLLFLFQANCRTRKFSGVNKWEEAGERRAAIESIVSISKEIYQIEYMKAKPGSSLAEFEPLATKFANDLIEDSRLRSSNGVESMSKESESKMVLEDHYYEYKNSKSEASREAFKVELESAVAYKFNWAEWLNGKETLRVVPSP
jgi:hypothetical protein